MEAVATLRNCPMSARKMRLVVDNIRGKSVDDAFGILKYTNKEAAIWLEKLLLSAVSNWANKSDNSPEEAGLIVKTAFVNDGPVLKRFRPAPHGRAHRIRKRMNHVTLIVENKNNIEA
jgi:large subunit ribosomal protein L22